jgi:hypothetical protein
MRFWTLLIVVWTTVAGCTSDSAPCPLLPCPSNAPENLVTCKCVPKDPSTADSGQGSDAQ